MRHQCGPIHKNQGCHNTTEDNTTFHQHSANWAAYLDNGQLDIERVLVSHHVWARVQLLLSLGQPVHAGLVTVQEVLMVINVLLRVLHLFLSHKSPLMFSSSLFPHVHRTFDSFVNFFQPCTRQSTVLICLLFFFCHLSFVLASTSTVSVPLQQGYMQNIMSLYSALSALQSANMSICTSQSKHNEQGQQATADSQITTIWSLIFWRKTKQTPTKYDHRSYMMFSTHPA